MPTPPGDAAEATDTETSAVNPSPIEEEPAPPAPDATVDQITSDAEESAPIAQDSETPLPGAADDVLPPALPAPPATLQYQVSGQAKGFNYQASGTLVWQPAGERYEARLKVSAFLMGSREQVSEGRLDGTGLHPERFTDRNRRDRVTELNATTGELRLSHGGQHPLQAGTQDRLTVSLQLGALFNANPQGYPEGSTIRLPVTDVTRLELWDFVVGAQETLAFGGEDLTVRRLSRVARRPGDRQVDIWLAPRLNHLPARVRVSESNGDHIDQRLESVE